MAKVLAIDYGSQRVGLAIGDESQGFVAQRPAWVGLTGRELWSAIGQLVSQEAIGRVIVGLPLGLKGTDTVQTKLTRRFAEDLRRSLAVPVELVDERLTSQLADRIGRRRHNDSAAAALLLTDYLERQGHGR